MSAGAHLGTTQRRYLRKPRHLTSSLRSSSAAPTPAEWRRSPRWVRSTSGSRGATSSLATTSGRYRFSTLARPVTPACARRRRFRRDGRAAARRVGAAARARASERRSGQLRRHNAGSGGIRTAPDGPEQPNDAVVDLDDGTDRLLREILDGTGERVGWLKAYADWLQARNTVDSASAPTPELKDDLKKRTTYGRPSWYTDAANSGISCSSRCTSGCGGSVSPKAATWSSCRRGSSSYLRSRPPGGTPRTVGAT